MRPTTLFNSHKIISSVICFVIFVITLTSLEFGQTKSSATFLQPAARLEKSALSFPGPEPQDVPAVLEAENFDRGGESVGYHEVFGATGSALYRHQPAEGVDIQARAGASRGFFVMEAAAGEWLSYTILVKAAGSYDLGIRYSSELRGGTFHVEIDGQNVTGAMTVIPTGKNFRALSRMVRLSAGQHVLHLVMDSNSVDSETGTVSPTVCDFDSIIFRAVKYDFDGDGKTNSAVFRPFRGIWLTPGSDFHRELKAVRFGQSVDITVSAYYDGDTKYDVAVFRPANGSWYTLNSSTGFATSSFGMNEDIPVTQPQGF